MGQIEGCGEKDEGCTRRGRKKERRREEKG